MKVKAVRHLLHPCMYMYVCKYVNFYERDLALPLYNPKPIVIAKQAETKKRHVTLA